MTEQALSGLRVVEWCGWNGVLAGRMLADSGADVVRVVPDDGDPLDHEPPFTAGGASLQAAWYNAGKHVLQLDGGAAQADVAALLDGADILIEDWGPNAPAGVDIAALNPGLVRVTVTPFGQGGPWANHKTVDIVANALSGAASVTGTAETPPLNGYGNQTYHTVGMYAGILALAGWYARQATGQGQHIDLSAHEALIGCTEQLMMQWWFPQGTWGTPIAARQGSLHWSKAYAVYPTKTGYGEMITAALRFPDVLLPWLKEMGAEQELGDAERYPDVIAMIRDLPTVMRVLREWVGTWDADELFFEAQKRHQPFGPVWDIPKAAASPQLEARGYFETAKLADGSEVRFPGRLFRTDADGPHPATTPPRTVTRADLAWTPRPREEAAPPGSSLPLKGVRIFDFTHVLAGPFGTRVLGDLGADVIKVGTAVRGGGANSTGHPYYVMWNRNKRSINLNMSVPEGRELARRLASKCDVIIENFSAGVLRRWGLDRASMAETNPGLTVISMGGTGQTGPWKDFVTFAPTIHAMVGLTYLTNPPGEHLLGYGFSLTDHLSGLVGAYASLTGIEHKRRTGQGLDIDVSQYEVGMGLMAPAFLDYFANGTVPEPVGNRHPFGAYAPHGIYPCQGDDLWVAIAVRGDDEFGRLAAAMGQPGLATDVRFATHEARLANQDALDDAIAAWTRGLDRYEVMARCQAAGVPAGAVQNAEDLSTKDPQNAARDFFTTTSTGPWGEHGVERFPALVNGQRPPNYVGAAESGADTFDVLEEVLGLDGDEIAALAEAGALT